MKPQHALLLLLALAGIGCQPTPQIPRDSEAPKEDANGIYYWKTTFELNETEKQFLVEHQIDRLYLRLFDVVPDNEKNFGLEFDAIPNATIIFKQELPKNLEIVPVVYITIEALRKMDGKEEDYAKLISERVTHMADFHDMGVIHEVQLDCDWTQLTQESYFLLCEKTAEQLRELGIRLSCTVRLWQLSLPTPPVDRGVLMLYNTGPLTSPNTTNSILDINDVKPYLKTMTYGIPLDYALPTYEWYVWFRDGQYHGLLHQFNDSLELQPGDIIRHEQVTFDQIMEVKQTAMSQLQNQSPNIILYHLDSANLSNYTSHEIDQIFSRN